MIREKIHKSLKKNDLQTSKLILYKLIKHYSYDSIVDYLLNPNKINNPKLEIIMKRLINKIGVDTLAFLLCNDNLNSYNINNNNSKEEEKTLMKSNYDNEREKSKFKASIKKLKKKYKNKLIKKNKAKNDLYKYKYRFKYKNKKNYYNYEEEENYNNNSSSSKDSNEMMEESESNNKFNSSINSNSVINSNINNNFSNYSDLNDFSEFCDSNINNEDIINIVNEMEEEDKSENQKEEKEENEEEEESEIILDETNSYVYNIIYKEPISGELYYYIYESINEDKTINMKCIDELCKSKGVYNSINKQIIISVQHTIIYEEHCYLKPNFGGEELNLEIFDFIKDSPDIKGIEILKSKEKYIKNKREKNNNIKTKKKKEENEDNLMDEENLNELENIINGNNEIEEDIISENHLIDDEIEKKEKEQPIYQNKIANNIVQIIKINDKEKNDKNKKKNKKENYTLINYNVNNNNSESNFARKQRLKSCSRNRNYSLIENNDIKLVDTNNNDIIKEEKDINNNDKDKNNEIKKEEIKQEEIKEEIKQEKEKEKENVSEHKNIINPTNPNEKAKNENLDKSYNYIEFNIDNIKKYEGTENCYSKKVNEINIENKKYVDEQNKISKNKKNIKKSKERITEKIFSRSSSHSMSSSYLMVNESEIDDESQSVKIICDIPY